MTAEHNWEPSCSEVRRLALLIGFENASVVSKLAFLLLALALPTLHDWAAYLMGLPMVTALYFRQALLPRYVKELAIITLFSSVLFVIAIPDSTIEEMTEAAWIAIGFFWIAFSSLWFALVIDRHDTAELGKLLRLPNRVVGTILVLFWLVPSVFYGLLQVITSQRSRGLEIRLRSILRPLFYQSLIVPFLHFVLRQVCDAWVLVNVRPVHESFATRTSASRLRYSSLLLLIAVLPWVPRLCRPLWS